MKNILRWGDMNFDLSYGDEDLSRYYADMFTPQSGTTFSRLRDQLKYENTGNTGTIRVSAKDLRDLLNITENLNEEARRRQMDLDLRSDPEIVNIPESIDKELNIKRLINFKLGIL